jgi:hypothetical protein
MSNITNDSYARYAPSSSCTPQPQVPILTLYSDVFLKTASSLQLPDIINLTLTCKQIAVLCAPNSFWEQLIFFHFPQFQQPGQQTNHFEQYVLYSNCGLSLENLPKIGIVSFDDFEVVCGPSIDIKPLEIVEIEVVEDDPSQLQLIALERKETLITLTNQLLKVVRENRSTCGSIAIIMYHDILGKIEHNIVDFQHKLSQFSNESNFSTKNYNSLTHEFNELLDNFKHVHQKLRLKKLHTYITQGIYENVEQDFEILAQSWKLRLEEQRICCVSELKPEDKVFYTLVAVYRFAI